MTNEEAISYLESIPKYIDYNNEAYYAVSWQILEAIELAIEALKAQRWIPCKEKLPKDGTYVLVNTVAQTPYKMLLATSHDVKQFYDNGWINAWMPLPEAYKEDEQ